MNSCLVGLNVNDDDKIASPKKFSPNENLIEQVFDVSKDWPKK